MPRPLRRVATRILDFVLPQACLLCGARGTSLCAACEHAAVRGLRWHCPICAVPFASDHGLVPCGRCLRRRPAFACTVAAATFEPPFDQLVRGLKYAAHLHHAPVLARLLAARCATSPFDLIVPVPLSRERMAARGFNQSLEIARHLGHAIGRPVDTRSLLRIRETPPQAALRFAARRTNIRGAFALALAATDAMKGRTIGVVDDVMTTGSTLDEVARVLRRAGARTVINLVAARTP